MKPYFLFLPIPVLLLTSCGSEPARRAAQPQAPPVAVQVAAVNTQDWPTSYEATGTVRARTTATISSKVMGYVQQVSVQVGDRVRQGQVLITLDAGKTTLTEKLLLYGGAVQLAGSVTARKNQRATASDWMELEKKRGISISSTVLQFDYNGYRLNLLDTPGHKDFSEDTYRVLTAVDAVVMVID